MYFSIVSVEVELVFPRHFELHAECFILLVVVGGPVVLDDSESSTP
jgi:hypothetical protein